MTKVIFAAFVLMLSLSTVGFAAPAANKGNPTGGKFAHKHARRNEVNKRVKNQRQAINRDEKDGKLTKAQGNQLKANDRAIKEQEHADVKKNGGHITKGEQKQLNQEEDANRKLINSEANPK